nr:60S ribosomal protein L7-2-like [Tanacetum cinerariifolium]
MNRLIKRLHDEEVEQAAAREKQKKDDLERAKVLQQRYVDKEERKTLTGMPLLSKYKKNILTISRNIKVSRKPVSIAQARKNMIIYLKNMAGIRWNTSELKAVAVSGFDSTQETPSNDPKEMSDEDVQNMLEIIPVSEFKVEALQVMYPIIDWEIHSEASKRNIIMILMLSAKLQVDEDCEMARDLVMKIFMEANKPKSRRINAAGLSLTVAGSRLMLLGKADIAAEEFSYGKFPLLVEMNIELALLSSVILRLAGWVGKMRDGDLPIFLPLVRLDFHLVQLFFVCLPSLAVYLVAQYARHEMKKMDAQLEKMKIEEAKKVKAAEDDVMKSNPQLLEFLFFSSSGSASLFLPVKATIMAEEEPKPLNFISETVLKKRKNNEDWANRRKEQLEQRVKKSKSDNFVIKKPEQFIREYRDKEADLIKMKHRGKRPVKASMFPQSKLLFVIRIQGKNDMCPQTRKHLYSLRLRRVFTGVFVKANERVLEILQKVEPYVTYGYPNLKSVNELIYKKGLAKVNKQVFPLTDNNIIEQAMGEHKIICIEDIVNEIGNVGPHFKEVCSFLCPFNLNKPDNKVLQGKKKPFKNGGDSGNREDQINELISKMN